jgi:serine/threonine protein kinase/tetratricopeptide (TPR) repeat protein
MSSDSRDYSLIERLADEFAERLRRGERPSPQEYFDRYPEVADDLRELLPAAEQLEEVQEQLSAAAREAAPAVAPLPHLADFHILREVGRGGMGVVYEAEQVSLGRRVALKVLRQKLHDDSRQKRRFEREARAAARLHHTNIVPVFGFGEADGSPYYVMQFIQGLPLDEVIQEVSRLERQPTGEPTRPAAAVARSLATGAFLPPGEVDGADEPPAATGTYQSHDAPAPADSSASRSNPSGVASAVTAPGEETETGARRKRLTYWQGVARLGVQAAQALEHAHRQGVIHRDVKPSNLLLDAYGTLWVTDFGLAKADDQQNLTETGDLLGTYRYMPPEAFEGHSDARSDVYSLGLTLYELLALRPAFDARGRNQLVKQVTTGEAPRLRSIRRDVPRDLDTVIHKAIERDPAARYPTAGEFAADLQRFLDDEPIRARRVGLGQRARRWCLRNPWIAGSVAAVVLVFLLAFAAVNVALWRTREAERLAASRLEEAERSEREARFQKEQADLGFARARKAVDEYLNQVTDGDALKAPGLQTLRRDLLRSALTFYQEFLRERRDDPALRSELAAVHLRVARILGELGNEEERASAAREAVKLYEALAAGSPQDEAAQAGLIEAHTRANQAARGVAVGEPFVAAHPEAVRAKERLAEAYNGVGIARSESADQVGTMQAYERSLRLREQLFQRDPANADYELGLAIALNNIGVTLASLERTADALVLYRHSLDHARNLFARRPRDFAVIRLLFRGLNNSSGMEESLDLFEEALTTNSEGLELTQKLMKSDPDVPEHPYFCHVFAVRRAEWLDARNRRAEALAAYRVAAETSASPLLHGYSLVHAVTWIEYAIADARCAELIGEVTTDPVPEDRAEQERLAALAVRHLRQGLDAGYRNFAFLKYGKQLDSLRSRKDFQELRARAEKEAPTRKGAASVAKAPTGEQPPAGTGGLPQPTPSTPAGGGSRLRARGDAAVGRYAIGMMQFQLGQWEKAEKSLLEAQTQYEAILHDDPKALRYRLELGRTLIALGDLYRDARKLPDALRSWIAGRDCLLSLLKEVAGQDPLAVESASLLAALGGYLGDFMPSEADLAASAALGTSFDMDPYDLLQHGLNCLIAHDAEAYRRACERMLKGFPNKHDSTGRYSGDAAVLCALGANARIELSRYLPLAERGAKLADPHEQQYRNGYLALSYYRAGKLDKALDRLDFCDRIATFGVKGEDGHTVAARAIRALVLHHLGRREDSKSALEQAKRWYPVLELRVLMRPVGPRIFNSLPNTLTVDLVRIVLREASSEVTGEAFRADQWNNLRRAWGEAYFGRNDRARAAVDQAGPIDPKDAGLLAARAFVLAQVGETGRANADCEAALRIDPDQLLARYARGRLALAQGRPAAAAEDLVRVLAQLPDLRTPEADRFIVDGLLASSDAAFRRAVELRPKDPQLWVARGRYLAWHDRWKEAADAYARGVEQQPLYHDWIEYGCALILAGDLDGYRRLCARVVARMKSPDREKGIPNGTDAAGVAIHLAALHPESGVDPKLMTRWAIAAWGTTLDNFGTCLAAGMAREREGEAERAITLYGASLNLARLWGGRDLNWYGLAIAKGRLGQTEEAHHWLDQAEASLGSKLQLARNEPTVRPGTYLYEMLEARVRSREVQAILAHPARASGDAPPVSR